MITVKFPTSTSEVRSDPKKRCKLKIHQIILKQTDLTP